MSKGSWRRMDLRGWRCKNVYDDAMIFNDDLNIPVKAGHHGRRGGGSSTLAAGRAGHSRAAPRCAVIRFVPFPQTRLSIAATGWQSVSTIL